MAPDSHADPADSLLPEHTARASVTRVMWWKIKWQWWNGAWLPRGSCRLSAACAHSTGERDKGDVMEGYEPRTKGYKGYEPKTKGYKGYEPRTKGYKGYEPRNKGYKGFEPRNKGYKGYEPRTKGY